MISEKSKIRLGKLDRIKPFHPRWNQEKYYVAFVERGLATSDLYRKSTRGMTVKYQRGFLLTEKGKQLLESLQPSSAKMAGDQ